MDKYEFKKTMTKWDVFGLMMRYLSVSAVTVALVALCSGLSWWPEMEWIIIAVIVVAGALLPITLLFLCYYIYHCSNLQGRKAATTAFCYAFTPSTLY